MKLYRTLFLAVLLAPFVAFAQKPLQFSFKDLQGKTFTHQQLVPGQPTMVMFFDPYCDHCEQQAKYLRDAKDKFLKVNLVWVTTEDAAAAKSFRDKNLPLSIFPKVHVLTDPEFVFDGYFGYSEVPSIYLFNKEGKRVKDFHHETPAAELLKYL